MTNNLTKTIEQEHEELMEEVRVWHFMTFIYDQPEPVTLAGQFLKSEEELREVSSAKTLAKKEEENGDFWITLAGLRNFNSVIGALIERLLGEFVDYTRVDRAIRKKMEINRKRKWKNIGKGIFHH